MVRGHCKAVRDRSHAVQNCLASRIASLCAAVAKSKTRGRNSALNNFRQHVIGKMSQVFNAAESTRLRLVGINVAAVRGDRVRLIRTDGTGERAQKP